LKKSRHKGRLRGKREHEASISKAPTREPPQQREQNAVGEGFKENIKRQGIKHVHITRFSSYPFQTTHLFKTRAYENTPFEECNQRWLGFRDSEAQLHLYPCKQNPSSVWREACGGGSCGFCDALPQQHAYGLWSSQLLASMCDNMMFVEGCYKCLQ